MSFIVLPSQRALFKSVVFLVGITVAGWLWLNFWINPSTRNGQVMAQVIQITPRVSGTIVDLPVIDNQFVRAGDLLFQIDPRTYQSTLDQKEAILDKVRDEIQALAHDVDAKAAAVERYNFQVEQAKSQIAAYKATSDDTGATYRRMQQAVKAGAVSRDMLDESKAQFDFATAQLQNARDTELEARASKLQAEADWARAKADLGAEGEENSRLRAAKAAVHHAHLALEFTEVVAPVDGYVTNLNLRLGDHATAKKPLMALVDVNSFWVTAFFKEHKLKDISVGDVAIVKLLTHPDTPLEGRVVSRAWGVEQEDGTTGQELLPEVHEAYEYLRLPQRVPVRIEFDTLPEGVELIVGTTASVIVKSGTSGDYKPKGPVSAAQRTTQ